MAKNHEISVYFSTNTLSFEEHVWAGKLQRIIKFGTCLKPLGVPLVAVTNKLVQ